MPKIYSNFYPYHIYGRSNNKEWFSVEPEICWDIFRNRIKQTIEAFSLDIHAFVLMANHYHFLLSTPASNISQAMHFLLTQISKDINKHSGRINHVFGGRYKSSMITNMDKYFNVYKYILRNPVEAAIAEKVQDYSFSTIHETLGARTQIKIIPNQNGFDSLISKDKTELLNWLNSEIDSEIKENIKKGIYRSIF